MAEDILGTEDKNKKLLGLRQRRQLRDRTDLMKVLSLPEGRRLLWRILGETGVFKGSFTGDNSTFFNEGRRDIGLFLLKDIMRDHSRAFADMQREAASDKLVQEGITNNVKGDNDNG